MIPADAPYNSVRKRRTYFVDSVLPAPLSPLMMMDWFIFRDRMSLKALSAAMREGRGRGNRRMSIRARRNTKCTLETPHCTLILSHAHHTSVM